MSQQSWLVPNLLCPYLLLYIYASQFYEMGILFWLYILRFELSWHDQYFEIQVLPVSEVNLVIIFDFAWNIYLNICKHVC